LEGFPARAVVRVMGIGGNRAVYSPVKAWPVRSQIPVAKTGQSKLKMPCTNGGNFPSGGAKFASWRRVAVSHCACRSLMASSQAVARGWAFEEGRGGRVASRRSVSAATVLRRRRLAALWLMEPS
jgi:hypothetical protein